MAEVALDVRWSWNYATDQVCRQLNPELWASTHNPSGVLKTVWPDQIERVFANPAFRKNVDDLVLKQQRAADAPGTGKTPDLATATVPDKLVALPVNPNKGLTKLKVDTRRNEHGCNEVAERKEHPGLPFFERFRGLSARLSVW